MNKREIIEQLTHKMVTSKLCDEKLFKEIINLIEESTSSNFFNLEKDYNYHIKEIDKHYKRWLDSGKKSSKQYKKHLRHLFIKQYIESKIITINVKKLMKDWYGGVL